MSGGNSEFDSRTSRMKKLSYEEERDALDFFRRWDVPEDPHFNADRNKAIIARTIKKNEELAKRKKKEFRQGLGEKIDMVASYLKSNAINGGTPIQRYLGKRWMAKLRGEMIMDKIKNNLATRNQYGQVIKPPKGV